MALKFDIKLNAHYIAATLTPLQDFFTGCRDAGGYPLCDCHIQNSVLQFKHVEEYLEEFQTFEFELCQL